MEFTRPKLSEQLQGSAMEEGSSKISKPMPIKISQIDHVK